MIAWIFKQGLQASGITDRLDGLTGQVAALDRKIDDRTADVLTKMEGLRIELNSRIDRSCADLATGLRAQMYELDRGLRAEIASLEKGTAVLAVRFDEAVLLRERLATLEEKVARGSGPAPLAG